MFSPSVLAILTEYEESTYDPEGVAGEAVLYLAQTDADAIDLARRLAEAMTKLVKAIETAVKENRAR